MGKVGWLCFLRGFGASRRIINKNQQQRANQRDDKTDSSERRAAPRSSFQAAAVEKLEAYLLIRLN